MTKELDYISDILELHYSETSNGIVEKSPSKLARGEGTEKNFFILKIDLVGSTRMLLRRNKSTYLKVAHTYLSSIDKITQKFGADPNQVEYAGDSVIAYFQEGSATAEDVITAACYARVAVSKLQDLDSTLNKLKFSCKIILHFAPLVVAKIGPRANSITTAIGHPLHRVAKIEKDIDSGTGRATKEFQQKVLRENKKFLSGVYIDKSVLVPAPAPAPQSNFGFLSFEQNPLNLPRQPDQHRIEKELIGYDLKWRVLYLALGLLQNPFLKKKK